MNKLDKRIAWAGAFIGLLLAMMYLTGCGDTYVEAYPQAPSGYAYSNDGYLVPVNPGIGFIYIGGGQYRYQNRVVYIDRPGHIVTTPPRHVTINVNNSPAKRSGGFNTSIPAPSSSSSQRTTGGFNRSTASTYSRPSSTATFSRLPTPVSRPSYSAPSVSRSSGGFRR